MASKYSGQAVTIVILSLFCRIHAALYGCDVKLDAQTVTGNGNSYLNTQWFSSSSIPCKGVVSTSDEHVVQTLWDGSQFLCNTQAADGGWLVIQRRFNGQVDFYKNWEDYKNGFGDVTGDFWFGNEKIYRLTDARRYELRVNLKYEGKDYYAAYSHFRVHSEQDNYRLEVSGYSGNAGNSMGRHNDMAFSTKDRDNDLKPNDFCAQKYQGGWWYAQCHDSNLNGLWGSKQFGVGLNWLTLTTYYNSATYTEMMIRPVE